MTAELIEMGRQTYDGLGRQRSVSVAGRTTRYHYQPGQLPPTANTLADGKRVTYNYEPQLGNALLAIEVEGKASERLNYHKRFCRPIQAIGTRDKQQWHFAPSGQLQQDSWTVDGQTHSTSWHHSLLGEPLDFTDAAGVKHQRTHDEFGRVWRIQAGEVRTTFAYDALSRPSNITTQDLVSGKTLSKHLEYDGLGRETRCTFSVSEAGQMHTFVQTQVYSNLDQLVSRTWEETGKKAQEHFAYDLRGRLVHYTANTDAAAQDPFGNAVVEQRFAFNTVDGLCEVLSTFADGSADSATFRYAESDPTQIIAINHTHPSWPAEITLTYDACGRVISDSLGRQLTWNSQDRLASVSYRGSTCHYHYSPSGQLCDRVVDDTLIRSFYSGSQLTHERQQGERLELVGDGTTLFAVNRITNGVRQSTLLGCDGQGSVRLEAGSHLRSRRYGSYGTEPGQAGQTRFGYCGERHEPLTGWIIPAGYRPYDPLLMCFLAPDSESPFGRGGINPYAYCAGDPINRCDPDGHSWQSWVLTGAGLAIGLIATVASLGTALPALLAAGGLSASAAMAVATAALNTLSLATGVAAMAMQASDKDENAASILGWISIGTGAASMVTGALLGAGASRLSGNSLRLPGRARRIADAGRRNATRSSPQSAPVRSAGKSEVLYEQWVKGRPTHDVVWHERFLGRYRALETHGASNGQLMNARGKMVDPVRLAVKEIAPRLQGVDPAEPLFLVACEGGSSGAAQRLADILRRPVYGYDKVIAVYDLKPSQTFAHSNVWTTAPTQRIPFMRRLMGERSAFSDHPEYEHATGRFYHPG
ncbi:RHS repeat-associated core domain-containing protein [Pseudomonas entomophila]|uniref:RHS repeat-associated core domain-containing protein n=1 Tax=Pseudomonas entomophila TaxID=312306 RepID=UPI00240731A2|nr:RHS repeat-associated core domain-containing protein [Pseudomonas entomophila]MDF9617539.1 RHS repeat-associated core domain-containing protein [Pseudomonas entomophila]